MNDIVIDTTPDKSLFKKLGMVGYGTEQAIAELIDNSIDARIAGTKTNVEIRLDHKNGEITVRDDGKGMTQDDLRNAWTIAKSRDDAQPRLGKFGMGMKSACSALGRAFTITTTTSGSEKELVLEYDEKKWLNDKDANWTNVKIRQHPADGGGHGTLIRITAPRVPMYPAQVKQFLGRFGIRYGPYIDSGELGIQINGQHCSAVKPEIQEGTKKNLAMYMMDRRIIRGWIGLLERRSIKGDYGIHLYREKRLIEPYSKFGIPVHPSVAQVIGVLHLDHVPVDVFKTKFLSNTNEYQSALARFKVEPAVIETLKQAKSHDYNLANYEETLSLQDAELAPRITRLSHRAASDLLSELKPVAINTKSGLIKMSFEDGDFGTYRVERHAGTTAVIVNKNSGVFRAFRNPLFFLMMLRLEIESMPANADLDRFVYARNEKWEEFIPRLARPLPAGSPKERTSTLPYELETIRHHISGAFLHNFQLTAMSTLYPFLHNSHNKTAYTIYVEYGTGEELKDVLATYEEYLVLLDPDRLSLRNILDTTDYKKLMIIREYASVPRSNTASLDKSWVDLYFEVTKKGLFVYADELKMLRDLIAKKRVSKDRILAFAKRKKIDAAIGDYMGALQ